MKLSLLLAAAISLASISFIPSQTVRASSFEEQELNQHQFAVIAAPYRHGYNLVVLEQIPGQQKCWAETGNSPTVIEPLFLNFDFTNACKRNSDSNNYSIRLNGRDYGLDYLTDIVEQDGELHIIGVPRDRSLPQLYEVRLITSSKILAFSFAPLRLCARLKIYAILFFLELI